MSEVIRSNIECDFLDEFINEFKTKKIPKKFNSFIRKFFIS